VKKDMNKKPQKTQMKRNVKYMNHVPPMIKVFTTMPHVRVIWEIRLIVRTQTMQTFTARMRFTQLESDARDSRFWKLSS